MLLLNAFLREDLSAWRQGREIPFLYVFGVPRSLGPNPGHPAHEADALQTELSKPLKHFCLRRQYPFQENTVCVQNDTRHRKKINRKRKTESLEY